MANLGETFDANQHDSMGSFEPLKADDYYGKIVASDIRDSKTPGNRYINFEIELMGKGMNHGEEASGRKVFVIVNKWNNNPKAVAMADKELATIIRACRKHTVSDTLELHNIPMIVSLGVEPPQNGYGPKNKVTNYQPTGGTVQASAQQVAYQSPQEPQINATPVNQVKEIEDKPPWA